MLHEARALAANDVITMLHGRAQGVWAPLLFGKALMGVHSAGGLVPSRLEAVADSAATAYFPSIATAHRAGNEQVVRRQVREMFCLIILATLPLVGVLWFAAPYLGTVLFGATGDAAAAELCTFVIWVTGIGIPISGLGMGMRFALQAVGLHARNAKDQMRGTVVGAFITIVLALAFGFKGFAASLPIRSLIIRSMQSRTFREAFPQIWQAMPWGRIAATTAVPTLILLAAMPRTADGNLARAILVTSIAGLAYLLAVWRSGLVHLDFR
jgi:O-antigen/teichoic acid export membrane protein